MQPIGPRWRSRAKSGIGNAEKSDTLHAVEIGRRTIAGKASKTVGAVRAMASAVKAEAYENFIPDHTGRQECAVRCSLRCCNRTTVGVWPKARLA
jgi:hypothetical protein